MAQVLEATQLDFSRYGDTLFEVFFAGGRLAAGGNVVEEGKKLSTNVRALPLRGGFLGGAAVPAAAHPWRSRTSPGNGICRLDSPGALHALMLQPGSPHVVGLHGDQEPHGELCCMHAGAGSRANGGGHRALPQDVPDHAAVR